MRILGRFRTILLLCSNVAGALLDPGPASGQSPLVRSLREIRQAEARIATVGHRLAVANVALCAEPVWRIGMVSHALSQYPERHRAQIAAPFGLDAGGHAVLALAHNGPAGRAGLREDDPIVAVDGAPAAPVVPVRRASFADAERLLGQIEAAAADGVVVVTIARAGHRADFAIRGERGCPTRFQLALSPAFIAAADGRYVQVSSGVLAFVASDAELAAVVAHELAHNILRHRARLDAAGVGRGLFAGVGRNARLIRATELEADRLSIQLLHRAGYDPAAAIAYVARASRRPGHREGGTHPPSTERLAAMQAEIALLDPVAPAER